MGSATGTRATVVAVGTRRACATTGAEVPLQCDGRPLTGWLAGERPDGRRTDAHFEFDFREPADPRIERFFGTLKQKLNQWVVPDIDAYDRFYKRLISRIELSDVSSSFAMEQIKFTTALPLSYA